MAGVVLQWSWVLALSGNFWQNPCQKFNRGNSYRNQGCCIRWLGSAGQKWAGEFSVWLSINKGKLPTPYLEQVFETCHMERRGNHCSRRCTQPATGWWLKRGQWRAAKRAETIERDGSSGVTLLEAWHCWDAWLAAVWKGELFFCLPLAFSSHVV